MHSVQKMGRERPHSFTRPWPNPHCACVQPLFPLGLASRQAGYLVSPREARGEGETQGPVTGWRALMTKAEVAGPEAGREPGSDCGSVAEEGRSGLSGSPARVLLLQISSAREEGGRGPGSESRRQPAHSRDSTGSTRRRRCRPPRLASSFPRAAPPSWPPPRPTCRYRGCCSGPGGQLGGRPGRRRCGPGGCGLVPGRGGRAAAGGRVWHSARFRGRKRPPRACAGWDDNPPTAHARAGVFCRVCATLDLCCIRDPVSPWEGTGRGLSAKPRFPNRSQCWRGKPGDCTPAMMEI